MLAFCLAACTDGAVVRPTGVVLDGAWHHVRGDQEPPGFVQQFTLALADTTLTGSGTWAGEAGPQGTLVVTGYVTGGGIYLDFAFSYTVPTVGPAFTRHFVGSLSSATDMVGTISTTDLPSSPEHFAKNP